MPSAPPGFVTIQPGQNILVMLLLYVHNFVRIDVFFGIHEQQQHSTEMTAECNKTSKRYNNDNILAGRCQAQNSKDKKVFMPNKHQLVVIITYNEHISCKFPLDAVLNHPAFLNFRTNL